MDQRHLSIQHFTKEEIISAMNTVRTNAAAGPDDFPAVPLRRCTEKMVTSLQSLYNHFLQTSVTPKLMNSARVTPVYKRKISQAGIQLPPNFTYIAHY